MKKMILYASLYITGNCSPATSYLQAIKSDGIKKCNKGCVIREKTGDCVMPREGIFAKVLSPGWIKVGDKIEMIG
ncbi:hypothetical protein [Sporomusa silvacetica]|uniref:hypothetical protein n=1 Tax=Sporomusa silvacetica TaxID=55504 RepID=UPI001B80BF67|nr:hypothetical protein [Sporomusa silvacetica]